MDYTYLPEVLSAVEMETMDAVIRIETAEDSLGRVWIENKESGKVCEFNSLFDVEKFELIAEHMRYWHDKSIAEDEAKNRKPSAEPQGSELDFFGTPAEQKEAQKIMGPMVIQNGKPADDSLQHFALR